MNNNAQVLITVLFLLVLVTMLISWLSPILRAEVNMRGLQRNGLYAFYLAQAGLERAKIELKNSWSFSGLSDLPLGDGTYDIAIISPSMNDRVILSSGSVKNALRTITVRIRRTAVGPSFIYSKVQDTWLER